MKTLLLLRHAKAETAKAGQDDHARVLSASGREEALGAGRALLAFDPDVVLCSTAERTRETIALVQQAMDRPLDVHFEPKLYMASAQDIISRLSALPSEVKTVLVVGHNPSMHELCMHFSAGAESDLRAQAQRGYPTATLADIRLHAPGWDELDAENARLIGLERPKVRETNG